MFIICVFLLLDNLLCIETLRDIFEKRLINISRQTKVLKWLRTEGVAFSRVEAVNFAYFIENDFFPIFFFFKKKDLTQGVGIGQARLTGAYGIAYTKLKSDQTFFKQIKLRFF